jgi:hypothetical protein
MEIPEIYALAPSVKLAWVTVPRKAGPFISGPSVADDGARERLARLR